MNIGHPLPPSPNEVVLEAGQRVKTENSLVGYNDMKEGEKLQQGVELLSDGNVESMFLVEEGLQEQMSLKVNWRVEQRPLLAVVGPVDCEAGWVTVRINHRPDL